jgi:hypothetical protein
MISWMNDKHGDQYKFVYSTPSQYVDALDKRNIEWPTKYDDGFPYAERAQDYWTGYFTSRANLKEYIRKAS